MLDTQTRSIYLEELKPPEGYKFDYAVATTFTLDLLTLLMAPLSLSLLEIDNRDDLLNDPLMVLESLRNTSDKLSIFCQDGYISVPKKDSLLYSYLEQAVIPVKPSSGKGIFHPKIWVLRYISVDDEVFYRILCLSRNLTFDCSWDTILCLEGYYISRKNGYPVNKPLRDFIRKLNEISVVSVSDERINKTDQIANEIYRVEFEVPAGFDGSYVFSPSGIPGYKKQSFPEYYDRALIVSPFITDNGVAMLTKKGNNNILVSRPESIDELSDKMYNQLIKNTKIYYMDSSVTEPEDSIDESEIDESNNLTNENIDTDFRGLHAKIFHFDHGWHSTIINGSANATDPGIMGGNVEFAIQITGKKSRVGISKFFDENDSNNNSFMKLLREYKRFEERPIEDINKAKQEKLLEEIRKGIISLSLKGEVAVNNDSKYSLTLKSKKKIAKLPSGIKITCYPITLMKQQGVEVPVSKPMRIDFPALSIQALTTFIAFTVTAKSGKTESEISFVLNIPIANIPDDRDQSILISIIKDKGRFIRYLLLILMEDPDAFMLAELFAKNSFGEGSNQSIKTFLYDIPLLEELVRAFSREPEKIDRIGRLVEDIKKSDRADEVIPLHFEETWKAFLEAHKERISS